MILLSSIATVTALGIFLLIFFVLFLLYLWVFKVKAEQNERMRNYPNAGPGGKVKSINTFYEPKNQAL
jgi:hypothetical protein